MGRMTKERAGYLADLCWSNMQGNGCDDEITHDEHQEVLAHWRTMAGTACYYDALRDLARDDRHA